MANKIKGEVTLKHDGKDYTMLLDFNALADFEDAAGVPNALEVINEAMGAKRTRTLFWCGLKHHHPEITEVEAGQILTANVTKLSEVLLSSFPEATADEPGNAAPTT